MVSEVRRKLRKGCISRPFRIVEKDAEDRIFECIKLFNEMQLL